MLAVVVLVLDVNAIGDDTGLDDDRNVEPLLDDNRSVTECDDGHPEGLIAAEIDEWIRLVLGWW